MSKITTLFTNNNKMLCLCLNKLVKINLPACFTVRNLYTQSTLGVDGYLQAREKIKSQFLNMSEKFRTKMSEYVTDNDKKYMIFTEDLKNMIHLAEDNNNDVPLIINMMKKFNLQNKELRFGSFIFGPVVMRMFHHLNKPNEALECFTSKELEGFFDQLITYQLLLDLLYENEKYDDVIKAFEIIKERQIQAAKYPRNIIVLTMAACYKQNTPESFKYALNLWKELNEVGHMPMRRAITFCAGLALNHGKPEVALEIISSSKNQYYVTIRNIKVLALANIGRLDETIAILKSMLDKDVPTNVKHTYSKEVIDRIHAIFEKHDDPTLKQEFKRIEKYLIDNGHITDTTLDSQLCRDIESPAFIQASQKNQDYQKYRNKYQGKKTHNYRVYNQRPGLVDMN